MEADRPRIDGDKVPLDSASTIMVKNKPNFLDGKVSNAKKHSLLAIHSDIRPTITTMNATAAT